MRHQELETNAHTELRKIVKTVDKKLIAQVQDGPSPQDPYVTLSLVQGNAQVTMEVSVEELRRAMENDRDRSMLRQKVRRAHERLFFPKKPETPFNTRAIRPGSEAFANLRPSGGRR